MISDKKLLLVLDLDHTLLNSTRFDEVWASDMSQEVMMARCISWHGLTKSSRRQWDLRSNLLQYSKLDQKTSLSPCTVWNICICGRSCGHMSG